MFNGTLEQLYRKLLGKSGVGGGFDVWVFVDDEEKPEENLEGASSIRKGKGKERKNITASRKGSAS